MYDDDLAEDEIIVAWGGKDDDSTSVTSQFRKLMSAGSGPDRRLLFRAVCMPQIYGPYMHCVPVPVLSLAQHKTTEQKLHA